MIKKIFVLSAIIMAASCTTIDMEPATEIEGMADEQIQYDAEAGGRKSEELAVDDIQASIDMEKQIVFVETPIYIPEKEAARTSVRGIPSVSESTEVGTTKPEDYSHAARLYDYHQDQVFEVYTQVLRTTDIYLEPGEIPMNEPVVSDSDRWVIGAGVSRENGLDVQHIYVKPKAAGLESSMIINTDKRVYHLVLRSYNTVYMPMVKWNYVDDSLPRIYINDPASAISIQSEIEYVDPRYLSFDYKMSFSILGKKPVWLPERIYDDGKKTYIVFDEQILQRELPAIFENKEDIVNYRVKENLLIIDKLIEIISIRYQGKRITVKKKRAE